MEKQSNFIFTLLSYISYKEKKPRREFTIPTAEKVKQEKNEEKTSKDEKDGSSEDKSKDTSSAFTSSEICQPSAKADDTDISTNIDANIAYLKKKFNAPTNIDIVIREFTIAGKYRAFISYLEGMVNSEIINNFILRPILMSEKLPQKDALCQLDFIVSSVLETNQTKTVYHHKEAVFEILSGNTLLYVDGCHYYIANETKGFPARGVEKPQIESVVTGPQEAFNETLRTNVSLVRKIIKNHSLTTEFLNVGYRNQSYYAIMYLNDVANPAIVAEVKRRMQSLDADFISGDGIMEQFIEDNTYSIIPTILTTERPDKTASHIVEGRVAILADGVPFAKIVPVTISAFLHSPEDAFMRFPYGTALRFIRYIGIFFALFLPAFYVAITKFHQEMIPTELLIAIAKAKETVPFPTIVEVMLMEIAFELIREAGIRIPGIIGNTLGIIGALILGQAAVQANIVSPVLIIIVAITGLGNFAVPNFNLAIGIRLIRFAFIIAGSALGFYGITALAMLVSIYFVNMKSFGVPFFAPIAPRTLRSKDLLIRHPVWQQEYRPDYVNALDNTRQPEISRKWIEGDPPYSEDNEQKK